MLIVTVHVNAPAGQAIGIKEQIAMDLEKYGDTRVVSVEEVTPTYQQMELGGVSNGSRNVPRVRR
ncbi:MAG: hypothetical protein IKB82_08300 [Clostridia bacterium]|nr:hypothetical protein [Clostridia bacterium]